MYMIEHLFKKAWREKVNRSTDFHSSVVSTDRQMIFPLQVQQKHLGDCTQTDKCEFNGLKPVVYWSTIKHIKGGCCRGEIFSY